MFQELAQYHLFYYFSVTLISGLVNFDALLARRDELLCLSIQSMPM